MHEPARSHARGPVHLQDAVARWASLGEQQQSDVHYFVLEAACENSWAQLEGRLRGALGLPPVAAAAATAAPPGL